ncbi:hypothetical protein COU18_00080 [Candidatus Kaiserbacteria bacterium CG10_big_fil_rev_8_21_14_0_10_51_14]|uniref:Uncharacterized protein n=1 Tax=Candidatus Kaiserbacteria bacterium CG10_big_fil_rev_8_21_14_0_10_51_14 TaxID=1974610 RepID=A0A2H0UCJ4_9BACT|nr:MAG: hypothetical protein COU18_00080 [Candidatus Kaiserbacteria bacterium CG10_big_fil_rev_8_21_14_0_10_51_14]
MSNLLPRDAEKAIWRMYLGRFILAGSLVAIISAALATFALLPMYVALHSDKSGAPELSSGEKRAATQQERSEIAHAQSLVTTLSPFLSAPSTVSVAIETALTLRPKGVYVDRIRYVSGEIMLVGEASTREGISAYRQALQSNSYFTTVSVPIGDLAGTQGGRFSVTLTGTF